MGPILEQPWLGEGHPEQRILSLPNFTELILRPSQRALWSDEARERHSAC